MSGCSASLAFHHGSGVVHSKSGKESITKFLAPCATTTLLGGQIIRLVTATKTTPISNCILHGQIYPIQPGMRASKQANVYVSIVVCLVLANLLRQQLKLDVDKQRKGWLPNVELSRVPPIVLP